MSFKTPIMIYEAISYHSYLIYSAKKYFLGHSLPISLRNVKSLPTPVLLTLNCRMNLKDLVKGRTDRMGLLLLHFVIYTPCTFIIWKTAAPTFCITSHFVLNDKENTIGLEREQLNDFSSALIVVSLFLPQA